MITHQKNPLRGNFEHLRRILSYQ